MALCVQPTLIRLHVVKGMQRLIFRYGFINRIRKIEYNDAIVLMIIAIFISMHIADIICQFILNKRQDLRSIFSILRLFYNNFMIMNFINSVKLIQCTLIHVFCCCFLNDVKLIVLKNIRMVKIGVSKNSKHCFLIMEYSIKKMINTNLHAVFNQNYASFLEKNVEQGLVNNKAKCVVAVIVMISYTFKTRCRYTTIHF